MYFEVNENKGNVENGHFSDLFGGGGSDMFWPMSLETFYFTFQFRSALCIICMSHSLFLFKQRLQGIPRDHLINCSNNGIFVHFSSAKDLRKVCSEVGSG